MGGRQEERRKEIKGKEGKGNGRTGEEGNVREGEEKNLKKIKERERD